MRGFYREMVRKSSSTDSSSSYNHMEKQVVKSSNEKVLRNGDNEKLKDKLCYGGETDAELLSWPPRGYTCSFCRRRFKSAQALGGHMNVHRRARAMLRSQSISPISSPPSYPWLPNSITTADYHPFQDDEHHFIYPNPNPHWPPYTPCHTINPSLSNLPHLPMIDLTPSRSLVTNTHKNSLPGAACNCKHMAEAEFHHAEPRDRAKKNCIRAENQLNGLSSRTRNHQEQDDVVLSRLSLGTNLITSRPTVEEYIDLELRLGF